MLINGKKIADDILALLKKDIEELNIQPKLVFILVGQHAPSQTYVRMKKKACQKVGILSEVIECEKEIPERDLIKKVEECNSDSSIHGILVQLPLPSHIDEKKIMFAIDPKKDVDGFHPLNIGKMFLGDFSSLLPCTPHGILMLLKKSEISAEGKHVVIIGRSNIVGKPLAAMLIQNKKECNATVTVCHSRTRNLQEYTKKADILITAIGKPNFIKKEMVKKDSIIIDVGINRIEENNRSKLVGDVDFEDVAPHVSKITPVPGGVGPMTIAMLLHNTFLASRLVQ